MASFEQWLEAFQQAYLSPERGFGVEVPGLRCPGTPAAFRDSWRGGQGIRGLLVRQLPGGNRSGTWRRCRCLPSRPRCRRSHSEVPTRAPDWAWRKGLGTVMTHDDAMDDET